MWKETAPFVVDRLHYITRALTRIIHEDFYDNRQYVATTSLTAGGLAARSVNILLGTGALLLDACSRPEEHRDRQRRGSTELAEVRRRSQSPSLRAPVSLVVSAVSSRTLVNNAG